MNAKRNTKKTGDLSEITVIAAFIRAGYYVSIPFGEDHRYDFIADKGGKLSRIQVKTGRLENGAIQFNSFSTHFNRGVTSMQNYSGQIDFFGVYCPSVKAVFLVPVNEPSAKGYLRWEPAKNGQTKKIREAQRYLFSYADQIHLVGEAALDGVSSVSSENDSPL